MARYANIQVLGESLLRPLVLHEVWFHSHDEIDTAAVVWRSCSLIF